MHRFFLASKRVALMLPLLWVAQSAQSESLFLSGMNWHPEGEYYYLGSILPTSGKLGEDGMLVKMWFYHQAFEYDASNRGVNVDGEGGEFAIGYQKFTENGRMTAYLGATHQDNDINDPGNSKDANSLRKHTGVRLQLEGSHDFSEDFGVEAMGSYTAMIDRYWGRVRPAWKVGRVTVGPEVMVVGGDGFDVQYYGAFVKGIPTVFERLNVGLSGGVRTGRNSGDAAGYGGLELGVLF